MGSPGERGARGPAGPIGRKGSPVKHAFLSDPSDHNYTVALRRVCPAAKEVLEHQGSRGLQVGTGGEENPALRVPKERKADLGCREHRVISVPLTLSHTMTIMLGMHHCSRTLVLFHWPINNSSIASTRL